MFKFSPIANRIAILTGISLSLSFQKSEICPYPKLVNIATIETFVAVGTVSMDQNILRYEPVQPGQYDCIDDIKVCTYYLDWDGFIRQCERGSFVP